MNLDGQDILFFQIPFFYFDGVASVMWRGFCV